MAKFTLPYRAEQVGSLLRPQALQDARQAFAQGKLDIAALRSVENLEIAKIVRKQEEIGLKSISDGEFRRTYFHLDFLQQLDGVSVTGNIAANPSAKRSDDGFTPPKLSVTGKLRHARNIEVDNFTFLQSQIRQGLRT